MLTRQFVEAVAGAIDLVRPVVDRLRIAPTALWPSTGFLLLSRNRRF
jgi:hypothetical protein